MLFTKCHSEKYKFLTPKRNIRLWPNYPFWLLHFLFHLSFYLFRKYIDFSDPSCNYDVTKRNKFAVSNFISSKVANPYNPKTNLSMITKTLREFKSLMDFGNFSDYDCQVVVRAKMEANPLSSSCRPTLRLQLFPLVKTLSIRNHTGII